MLVTVDLNIDHRTITKFNWILWLDLSRLEISTLHL